MTIEEAYRLKEHIVMQITVHQVALKKVCDDIEAFNRSQFEKKEEPCQSPAQS